MPMPTSTLSRELVDTYRAIATSTLGHITDTGYLKGITAQTPSKRLIGRAVTVTLPPMDGSMIREALATAQPGDVLVIDMGEDTDRACWGELRTLAALNKQVAGVVTNGCATDIAALNQLHFPVYATGISAITTRPVNGGGHLNETVRLADTVIEPGDLIVGDADGLYALTPQAALEMAQPALAKQDWEARYRQELLATDMAGAVQA
ncbi:RraA family protein [Saccharospirillum alexandrii]|uniref:RraA family protein n=1 Tax=Saccharospirillum alexandrii TaxID=2448477 RepID=UPI00373610DA